MNFGSKSINNHYFIQPINTFITSVDYKQIVEFSTVFKYENK